MLFLCFLSGTRDGFFVKNNCYKNKGQTRGYYRRRGEFMTSLSKNVVALLSGFQLQFVNFEITIFD